MNGHHVITQREQEMLEWLKQGKTSWEIGQILGISENTVNFHIKNLMKKLEAVNRPHLVAVAVEKRLLNID